LLADIALRNECLNFFNHFGEMSELEDCHYGYEILDDKSQEIVYLLEDLGLISVSYDYDDSWVGPQEVTVNFNKKGITELFIDRIKGKNSIIKKQALEFIAQNIAGFNTFNELVEFLSDLGVQKSLLMPNTKWRMVNDVLNYYASCPLSKDQKMVFKIIEEAVHPLMHNGDKDRAEETRKKFNTFLEYDHFSLDDKGILWQGWDDGSGSLQWTNKDGVNFDDTLNSRIAVIFPEKMSELYVYWNELIKLTKFYFSNKEKQKEEINNLYFEIIGKVENLLDKAGCGGLKNQYQRPFRNMIGCEFETENKGLTEADLFVSLYNFLGEITETSLPVRVDIEVTKGINFDFFEKIKKYIEENIIEKIRKTDPKEAEAQSKPTITQIEIVKFPELAIKGWEQNVVMPKPKDKKIQLQSFPKDLKWEQITITFLNGQEVIIKAQNKTLQTTYDLMGFQDEKKKLPNKQWELLLELSKRNGEMDWKNNQNLSQKEIDAIKKRKQNLSDSLRAYFQIQDSPFADYEKEKKYRIMINLIPENSQIDDEPKDHLGVKEDLKEMSPQIDDTPFPEE
jgi:hypothetical protein